MKRKNYIISLASALLMGTMALSLTACSSEDNIANNTQQPAQGEVRTYTVSIPATFSGDEAQTRAVTFDNSGTPPTATGSFETTENIYVYNETKGTLLSGTLHPSDISADKKHCQLAGTLTGTIDANDKLILAYNMNSLYTLSATSLNNCFFDYGSQKGTGAGIIDGGLTPSLTAVSLDGGVLTTQETATFAMQQAIFRLKFTDGTNAITVKSLLIESTGYDISVVYWPFLVDHYSQNKIIVSPTTPTSEYLYVSVCIKESATPTSLNFTVTDNNGYQYKGTKAAPSGGFKNGKYYYSSAATALTKQTSVKPAITWTSVKDNAAVEPDGYYCYKVWGPWNGSSYTPSEITISGTSAGYYFFMENDATIHLSSLTATYDDDSPFILSNDALNLDISGENIIYCKSWSQCVYGSPLKLSGNGTLTVTANEYNRCGLFGDTNYTNSNNLNSTTTEVDVTSLLAADGYTVTRSARTDNADGTYTWTYTVAPDLATPLTLEACADGSISVDPEFPISYSVNGGALVEISADTEINVTAGQKVSFYSTNSALAKEENSVIGYTNINPHIQCYVYGNVMSLIDDSGNGFANDKEISAMALCGLFQSAGAANLINHPTKPILLPATTLASKCYQLMFMGCSSLTTAPDLPAPTLAESCYEGMFMGCSSLNSVKCLATIVSADKCLDNWLFGVSATGTLVKASGADWAKAGSNGIPAGWTVTSE